MKKKTDRLDEPIKTDAELIEEISLLRSALDAISDGFILFDADDRVLAYNSKHLDLFPSVAEILKVGLPYRELLETQVASGQIDAARGREGAWVKDWIKRHKIADGKSKEQVFSDGTIIRLSEHRTPSGGIVAVRTDITDLKASQDRLQESEQKFRDFAEASADWFWETDREHKLITVTDNLRQFNGNVDPKSYIGKTRYELVSSQQLNIDDWKNHLADLQARRSFRDFEYDFVDRHGVMHNRAISGLPVYGEDGTFNGFRGVGRDITPQKQAALALKKSQEDLKYEIDAKNRFFSIISHDLKSPFTSLLGQTEVMSRSASSLSKSKLIEYANDVNVVGKRVFDLLHNLLEWSVLQMDGAKSEPKTIQLEPLSQQCVDVLTPIALGKNVNLRNKIADVTAYADEEMVQSIIRNLVSNSLKFTPSGGTVEVSSRDQEGWVQITVADTGIGMTLEQSEKIFAFDQKTTTAGTDGEIGTGLGLPLSKELVEQNGGQIWFESTSGQGSKFHFTLPLKAAK